jgi:hypothetical protein
MGSQISSIGAEIFLKLLKRAFVKGKLETNM